MTIYRHEMKGRVPCPKCKGPVVVTLDASDTGYTCGSAWEHRAGCPELVCRQCKSPHRQCECPNTCGACYDSDGLPPQEVAGCKCFCHFDAGIPCDEKMAAGINAASAAFEKEDT